jgi:hypothetical protein
MDKRVRSSGLWAGGKNSHSNIRIRLYKCHFPVVQPRSIGEKGEGTGEGNDVMARFSNQAD